MKLSAKIIVTFFFAVCIVTVLGFFWITHWNPNARKTWENVENAKKVEIGTTREELLEIMGEPVESESSQSEYFYQPPFAASAGIVFYFENDTVIKVQQYEPT